ncbi:AbrB/MazE/SpoVT family DNA-binding domain-containing protein [Caldalkalibacillus thermarum TA2.A1]|uniref:AbrB/MazE/SpoVT family DNA-binding domain-containing protein n=2 Tax=Caldalkalibacillus thermarum (strain TA2.A1) TaxID=986075 RepID=A0A8X8I720_CALTT|nr:AbrB/MazE/SpoVT family DNA-binding domain-containing protein [Caldalkalibacillus thermarum TA2.A1]
MMLKSTGIVRKVDELGRVVIPIELRRTLGIAEKDALEIYVDGDKIILKKYEPRMACMITGQISEDNLVLNDGKMVLSPDAVRQLLPIFEEYLKKQEAN